MEEEILLPFLTKFLQSISEYTKLLNSGQENSRTTALSGMAKFSAKVSLDLSMLVFCVITSQPKVGTVIC